MSAKNFYKILTEDELFTLIKNDKSAEGEFYRRYKIRVKWLIKNYRLNTLEREDLIQEGMIGLFQAIQSYDPQKGVKFSTYSGTCIRNRILNSLNELIRHRKAVDVGRDMDEIIARHNPEAEMIDSDRGELLKQATESLTPLEKQVLDGYLLKKSYKLIAKELEISDKKVDNILVKIRGKLAKLIRRGSDS